MDPTRQAIDSALLVTGIALYVTATLVLLGYFLTRAPIAQRIGAILAVTGSVVQLAELGTRWWMTGVWPLTNLYGSLSLFSAFAVAIFAFFATRFGMWLAGWVVVGIAAIALGYGTTWNEGYMPAVPALQSYWIKIHVPLVILSYATFLSSFAISIVFLVKSYANDAFARGRSVRAATGGMPLEIPVPPQAYAALDTGAPGMRRSDTPAIAAAAERGDATATWLENLPTLARLDAINYKVVAVGLPLLSIGIITGAMWAKEAWGAYWQWDPKETAALFSWILYAGYLHLYTRPDWKGRKLAWWSVAAFASIVFCYLGVNVWISGLHSYKM